MVAIIVVVATACGSEVGTTDTADAQPVSTTTVVESTTTEAEPSTTSTASTTSTEPAPADESATDVATAEEFFVSLFSSKSDEAIAMMTPELRTSPAFGALSHEEWYQWWNGETYQSETTGATCVADGDNVICEGETSNSIERAVNLTNYDIMQVTIEDGQIAWMQSENRLGSWYWAFFSFLAETYPDDPSCTDQSPLTEADWVRACHALMSAGVVEYVESPGYIEPIQ